MNRMLSLFFIFLIASNGHAADQSSVPPSYCGVYSLYHAARALGRNVSFGALLKPEFISSQQGSSLRDLIHAAEALNLHAEPMGRMTSVMLGYVDSPVILHVKNDLATAEGYNHWILFMGVENGKARVYDSIRPVELIDFADLAARWDGIGLLVSEHSISFGFLWLVAATQFIFYSGACVVSIALLCCLQRRLINYPSSVFWANGWRRSLLQLQSLLVLAIVFGFGFRWVHASGYLSSSPSINAIQDKHLGAFLPRVKAQEVLKLIEEVDVVVIDARLDTDFTNGHLPKARNVPVNSSLEDCETILADVSTSKRILLYCQSNGCPYSEIVARKLITLGYHKILYFRDGWVAWQAYQQSNRQ